MGDALLYPIEAKGYGIGLTDGNRNGGGGEEHRQASGRPNRSSKKSSEGWQASQGQGEAMEGAVVDREGLGLSAHGEQSSSETKSGRRWWIRGSG
jgi:hypothetical protein